MQYRFENLECNGINLRVAVAGEGPLIVMVHGWPESWYSWRHQIEPLIGAGYRVAIPDVRGYGGSEAPWPIEAYTLREISRDLADLVAALGEDRVILFGHDWGGPIVWNCALRYPGLIRAVGALSVPYTGQPERSPLDTWREVFKDRFFYQLYFQKEGIAEAELEADMRRSLLITFYNASGPGMGRSASIVGENKDADATFLEGSLEPEELPAWLSEEDLAYYTAEFEASGMRGPLNRYRAQDIDFREQADLKGRKISQPAFFITGNLDPVNFFLPGALDAARVARNYEDLRLTHVLDGIGHWTQQEAPDAVNALLLEFLDGL